MSLSLSLSCSPPSLSLPSLLSLPLPLFLSLPPSLSPPYPSPSGFASRQLTSSMYMMVLEGHTPEVRIQHCANIELSLTSACLFEGSMGCGTWHSSPFYFHCIRVLLLWLLHIQEVHDKLGVFEDRLGQKNLSKENNVLLCVLVLW